MKMKIGFIIASTTSAQLISSACFGLESCVGLTGDLMKEAKKWDCNIIGGETSAINENPYYLCS